MGRPSGAAGVLHLSAVLVLLLHAAGLCGGCYAGAAALVGILSQKDKGSGGVDIPPAVRELSIAPLDCRDRIEVSFQLANEDQGRLAARLQFIDPHRGSELLEATLEGHPSLIEDVPPRETLRVVWDARRDLADGYSEAVQIAVTVSEDGVEGEPFLTPPFPAGNTPIRVGGVQISYSGDLVVASFEILDGESDPALLEVIDIDVDGEGFQPLPEHIEVRKDFLTAPEPGASGSLSFPVTDLDREGVARSLREAGRPGFVGDMGIRLGLRDFPCEALVFEADSRPFDNNEPPQVFPILAEEVRTGIVPLRFRLADREKNPADVTVVIDFGEADFVPALEFPLPQSQTRDLPTDDPNRVFTFLWDAAAQLRDRDTPGRVDLTLVVSDREPTEFPIEMQISLTSLANRGSTPAGDGPSSLTSGDYDMDGHVDLAVANLGTRDLVYLRGSQGGLVPGPPPRDLEIPPVSPDPAFSNILVSGNFDTDPFPDVAALMAFSNEVVCLRGGPEGLVWVRNLPAGKGPSALAAGDFTGDGLDDVAIANTVSKTVTLLRGGSDGLQDDPGNELPLESRPVALGGAHFDGDGGLDLAVACRSGFFVFQGGTERLARFIEIETGASDGLAVGDFNGDRLSDVALLSREGSPAVSFLVSGPPGAIGLRKGPDAPIGRDPAAILCADFDRDGLAEVAVASFGSDAIEVLALSGSGLEEIRAVTIAIEAPSALSSADYNGDGLPDLLALSSRSNKAILLQSAGGGLRRAAEVVVGEEPGALASGDFDGDGLVDAAAANRASDDVTFLRAGGFVLDRVQELETGSSPKALTSGDYDKDGYLDLLVLSPGSDTLTYMSGGARGLERRHDLTTDLEPLSMASGDFDGDGDPDVVAANRTGGTLSFFRRPEDPVGERIDLRIGREGTVSNPRSVLSGDFDGDLVDDAVATTTSDTVAFFLGAPCKGLTTESTRIAQRITESLASADFDGDGVRDVLVANSGSGSVTFFVDTEPVAHVFLGETASSGISPSSLATGDFDADGMADAAVATRGPGKVFLLHRTPFGFGIKNQVNLVFDATLILSGDFDGDGIADAVAGSTEEALVSYLRGGPMGFAAPIDIECAGKASHMLSGDFDGDGFLDVLVAHEERDVMTLLRGSAGGLRAAGRIPGGESLVAFLAGDFDADGFPEVVAASSRGNRIARFSGLHVVPHANASVEAPAVLIDPRFPPHYRLEVPAGARRQICLVPSMAFPLPQAEVFARGCFLQVVADPVAVLPEADQFSSPAQLTLRLLAECPGESLRVFRKDSQTGRAVAEAPPGDIQVMDDFQGTRGVSFPIRRFGEYLVASEASRVPPGTDESKEVP